MLGLGIDTGGTYTDAVIVDLDDRSVLRKAKSLTTHHDLSIGLLDSVGRVFESEGIEPGDIDLIGISTTLATNSILEDRGGDVGLILIGWEPNRPMDFGAKGMRVIRGGFDYKGKMVEAIDMAELDDAITEVSRGVDAIAVSGMFSVVNASQEKAVRSRILERTGLPVVSGHELSVDLGIDLRTETAVLNGRLIPVMADFFDNVQRSFRDNGLEAPIMVSKGDGSIMSLEMARERPVETILSGPAASAIGGMILSGLEDCVIVDIGGTSTDVAVLEKGFPRIQSDGATVGRWSTRVRAVDMWTHALGGDSRVWNSNMDVVIGPERVVPVCVAAIEHPDMAERVSRAGRTDMYMARPGDATMLKGNEAAVYDLLVEHGPKTRYEIIRDSDGIWVVERYLERLAHRGLVSSIGLTLTDVLHATGEYEHADVEAARTAVRTMAEELGVGEGGLISMVKDAVDTRVATEVLRKLLTDEFEGVPSGDMVDRTIEKASRGENGGILSLMSSIDRPLVGVGAPSKYIMPQVSDRLGTDLVLPRDFDVGNAIGAVCSSITETMTSKVTHDEHNRYVANLPFMGTRQYHHFESAISAVKRSLAKHLSEKVQMAGGKDIKVFYNIKESVAVEGRWGFWDGQVGRQMMNAEVTVRSVGVPDVDRMRRGNGRRDAEVVWTSPDEVCGR